MESAVLLLQKMQSEGYRIQQIPDSGADLLKSVNSHVTNDIAMMTDKQYEESMKLSGENYQDFSLSFLSQYSRIWNIHGESTRGCHAG